MADPVIALKDGSYADSDLDISLNIFEQDGASNNSVDNIRSLVEQVRIPPQDGKYKVFIIDEVHMLSASAFNAFLKTLEEPPPYAIFILATTEKHKILPTILSRCQIYDFRRIQSNTIVGLLEDIAKKEGIVVDQESLYLIAEKADGAMRDALSIFDRIASAAENKIDYKKVIYNLNILDYDFYFNTIDNLLTENHKGLMLLFDEVLKKGFEGDIFINGLAKHLRNLLYFKQDTAQILLDLSERLKDRYVNQAKNISLSNLLTFLNLCNQADVNYQKAKNKRLHIEIHLLKMCFANSEFTLLDEKKNLDSRSGLSDSSVIIDDKKKTSDVGIASTPKKNQVLGSESNDLSYKTKEIEQNLGAVPILSEKETIQKSELLVSPNIASIDDLINETKKEIGQKSEEKIQLDLSRIGTIWEQYKNEVTSPSTKVTLENVKIELMGEALKLTVPSSVSKEEMIQETDLYHKIRTAFNNNDLDIEIEIDRLAFPELEEINSSKIYTLKEKYDHLMNKNQELEYLVKKLKLKIEES